MKFPAPADRTAQVRIHVVTYRRPHLLARALNSLTQQTHQAWVAEVINDDPSDDRVLQVIDRIGDPRIQLSTPPQRRGGTGNFNHAFRAMAEPFASILEDDNWWEPDFLATMLAALSRHPTVSIACGNERIWREEPDGRWTDTGATIWPAAAPDRLLPFRALDKCGSAMICNSSLLFRTANAAAWQTPASIPIDVTEHFRERVLPHPLLLVSAPLANYAETLQTYRQRGAGVWGQYQALLIGSVFEVASPPVRAALAKELWQQARRNAPRAATRLLTTGLFQSAARALWREGTFREKIRFFMSIGRHPVATFAAARARQRHPAAWAFLRQGPFVDFMRQSPSTSL